MISVDSSLKGSVKVKAGKPLKLSAHVAGKPSPEVTWYLKDTPLGAQTRGDTTSLNIPETEAERHAGTYVIKAENEVGVAEATIQVTVIGELVPDFRLLKSIFRFQFFHIFVL